jgi:hypothetical protein
LAGLVTEQITNASLIAKENIGWIDAIAVGGTGSLRLAGSLGTVHHVSGDDRPSGGRSEAIVTVVVLGTRNLSPDGRHAVDGCWLRGNGLGTVTYLCTSSFFAGLCSNTTNFEKRVLAIETVLVGGAGSRLAAKIKGITVFIVAAAIFRSNAGPKGVRCRASDAAQIICARPLSHTGGNRVSLVLLQKAIVEGGAASDFMATSVGSTIATGTVLVRCAASDLSVTVANTFAKTIRCAEMFLTIQTDRAIGVGSALDFYVTLVVVGKDAAVNITSSFVTDSSSITKWHTIRKVVLIGTVRRSDTSSKDHTGFAVRVAVPVCGAIRLA